MKYDIDQGKGWGVFQHNSNLSSPSDSHEDDADVDVQAVNRAGEPSVHIGSFKSKTPTSKSLVTSSKWTDKNILERILANISKQDHHNVHHGVHDGGETKSSNVCERHNSISKDSNYTSSPPKPIIVLKGL